MFQITLGVARLHVQEVEDVRVLGDLLGEVGRRRTQDLVEVRRRRTEPQVRLRLDVMLKHWSGPSVGHRLRRVPVAMRRLSELLHKRDHMTPRQLCNDPLHYFQVGIWPGSRKRAHVEQVS